MRRFWSIWALALFGLACGDDTTLIDAGRDAVIDSSADTSVVDTSVDVRPDSGPPEAFLRLTNLRTESDCACFNEYTAYAELGCAFTLEADAISNDGSAYTGNVELVYDLWDVRDPGDGPLDIMVVDGAFRWDYTVTDAATDGYAVVVESTQFLYGRTVEPAAEPHLLCAYWTDDAGVPLEQLIPLAGIASCDGDNRPGRRVRLHAEIRGTGMPTVGARIREDDGGGDFDAIADVDMTLSSDGQSAEAEWSMTYPDPRDGTGRAEIYAVVELRRAGSTEPDDTLRMPSICLDD